MIMSNQKNRSGTGEYYNPKNPGVSLGKRPEQIMNYFDSLFLQGDYYGKWDTFKNLPKNEAPKEATAENQ